MFYKIVNYIKQNGLLKVASLNSLSVFAKLCFGVISSKVIAIFVGAEGMALIGNLRNFIGGAQSFASLGLSGGTVKYISEFKNNTNELTKVISTLLVLSVFAVLLSSVLIGFSAEYLNTYLFGDSGNFKAIVFYVALLLPFYVLNSLCLSIINGLLKFKEHIYIGVLGQFFALILTVLLIWRYALYGALLSVVIAPVVMLVVTLWFFRRDITIFKLFNRSAFSWLYTKNFISFSAMALYSAILIPLVTIAIRQCIADYVNIDHAGYWEAMQRVSNYYLMFATTLVSLYLLPKFSQLKTNIEFRAEVLRFYKTVMPVFAIVLLCIYAFRTYLVKLLFTSEFLPMTELFTWQLLGDFLKVLSIVIACQLIAKKMLKAYLISETISLSMLYGFSHYFIKIEGALGATKAHCLTFAIYLLIILFIFRKPLFSRGEINF